jgi:carnitine O-acetyltransferase
MRTPSQLSYATQDMKYKIFTSCMTVKNLAFQETKLFLSRHGDNGLSTRSRLYSNISKNRPHLDVRNDVSLKRWPTPFVDCNGNYENERFLEDLIGGPLYSEQQKLPMLPIPTIESSIDKLISSALPLAESEEETIQFHRACEKFPDEAMYLQKRLEARRTETLNTSWLSTWWNTVGYLQYRGPNVINVSYFFQLQDDETLPVTDKPLSIHRGACILMAMAEYRKLVCSGALPVEKVGKKNIPLCSVSFKYMFHSSRIPRPVQDEYRLHDPSLHKHCIVAVNGQFYCLDFVDEHDNPLPLSVLEEGLQKCMQLANIQKDWPQLGVFTSSDRDVWSENYKMLVDVGGEDIKRAMQKIESAAFMICLDDQDDLTLKERANAYWHGNPKIMTNRWFDKTIQVIVQKNGKVGLCGEHAMSDGMPMV